MIYFAIENPRARGVNKNVNVRKNYSQIGGAIMKLFKFLGALVIPLMLTGCIEIKITAGSGIEAGDPGQGGTCLFDSSKPPWGICLCNGACNCPSPLECTPGTS